MELYATKENTGKSATINVDVKQRETTGHKEPLLILPPMYPLKICCI
jgi:hypothetical protein